MRQLLTWMSFAVGCLFITVDIVRLNITGLFLLGVVMLVVWLWSIGAFRRDFWIADIDASHPDALGSLDLRERATREGQSMATEADYPDITPEIAEGLCDTHLNEWILGYRAAQLSAAAISAGMLHSGDDAPARERAAESTRLGRSLDVLLEERGIRRTAAASIAAVQRELNERNQA